MTEKTKDGDLEKQEVFIKARFNGYSFDFYDKHLNAEIKISNPDKTSSFKGTTIICSLQCADDEGKIDLTPLLHGFLEKIKENPESEVKCYATGFSPRMQFNKDLLSMPISKELLGLFSEKKYKD